MENFTAIHVVTERIMTNCNKHKLHANEQQLKFCPLICVTYYYTDVTRC